MDDYLKKFSIAELKQELKLLQSNKNGLRRQIDDLDTEMVGIQEELRKRSLKKLGEEN